MSVALTTLYRAAELAHLGEHVIYVARVDLAPVRDLREPISSDIVDATVSMWAADGYRWLTFLEHGSAAGLQATMAALTRACRQYVYLGDVGDGLAPVPDPDGRAWREAPASMNLLKYPEAAELLHVSERTARRIGARGEILEVRPSVGVRRVTEESVWQYLAANIGPRRQAAA